MHLSLVIPAYNEANRIGATLAKADQYLAAQDYDAEIVVVDDGSDDDTAALLDTYTSTTPLVWNRLENNRGKGYAVRNGMTQLATGAYRVFYDADASTPIEELEKLWPCFEDGADVAIGSRALPDSDVAVHQAWYRESMGRINNTILRALGVTRFKDTQCGFKGFTAAACDVVFPRQTIKRFSFDAELLFIAAKHGLRIDEVPVRWENSPDSRLNPVTDSTRMLWDLLGIRLKDAQGAYG